MGHKIEIIRGYLGNDKERVALIDFLSNNVIVIFTLLLLSFIQPQAAFGEQPAMSFLSSTIYCIFPHETTGPHAPGEGMWRFDPNQGTYQRVRPFYYTQGGLLDIGNYAYLASFDDRLLVEGWPVWIEIDAASQRILRRYVPLGSTTSGGWQIRGPVVTPTQAKAAGIKEGVYGFPACWYEFIGQSKCNPVSFPGLSTSIDYPTYDSGYNLLRRSVNPLNEHLESVADLRLRPYEEIYAPNGFFPYFSFSPNPAGFWWGDYRRVVFYKYPVLNPPAVVIEPLPNPFEKYQYRGLRTYP